MNSFLSAVHWGALFSSFGSHRRDIVQASSAAKNALSMEFIDSTKSPSCRATLFHIRDLQAVFDD